MENLYLKIFDPHFDKDVNGNPVLVPFMEFHMDSSWKITGVHLPALINSDVTLHFELDQSKSSGKLGRIFYDDPIPLENNFVINYKPFHWTTVTIKYKDGSMSYDYDKDSKATSGDPT